jgi:hypothetical protein
VHYFRAAAEAVAFAIVVVVLFLMLPTHSYARDLDGRYANDPLHEWFSSLKSPASERPCCTDADGHGLDDLQWDTKDGHYRVFVEGRWIDVPDDAIIKEPNRAGHAVVWTYNEIDSETNRVTVRVRCFLPGTGT